MEIVSSRGVLAAAMLLSAVPAAATNGMRMIGFGPVQDSMGGASVGAPLDSATIVTNPAGMSALGMRVDAAATYFKPTVKYTATDMMDGGVSGSEQESDRAASIIPTLGFIYPVNDKLSLGIGAFGVSGMGVDYKENDLFGSPAMTTYMNLRVAPAVSYKIADSLSVGVALNVMYATMAWDVQANAGGMAREDGSALGYGATVGVTWAPVKPLTLGLAYETKSFFGDFEFDLGATGTEKLDFDQPQVATVGASYQFGEALLVAADVEWINWSATNGKDQPEFTQSIAGVTNRWNMNWSDQVVVKIGAQYAATKELKIRAGYNYGKMPLDEARAFENVAFPAVSEHHISLGAGYDIGSLTVNVAGVYSPEATISGTDSATPGPAHPIQAYETKMSQVAVDLGLAYKF